MVSWFGWWVVQATLLTALIPSGSGKKWWEEVWGTAEWGQRLNQRPPG